MSMLFQNQVSIPIGKKGDVQIRYMRVTGRQSRMSSMRGTWCPPGIYRLLVIGGHTIMSNTPDELSSSMAPVLEGRGDVLIFGLGLGCILPDLLAKEEVNSVLVVEKNRNVIDLVSPSFSDPKLTIVEGDAFVWKPEKGRKFSTIFFDIWGDYHTDLLPEMGRLLRRCVPWKKKGDCWAGCWRREELLDIRRRERAANLPWA